MGKIEKVLCINRSRLPASWVQPVSVIPMALNTFIETCSKAGYEFVDRNLAETDSSKKQIIPYILLQTEDLSRTAVYNRQGSEQRLHDLWSVGIGGHINPVDKAGQTDPFDTVLESGMKRELDEELEQRPGKDSVLFSGVISEEKTDVGKVHLGAVFRILTHSPEAYLPGDELFDFQWEKTENLKNLSLEYWSTLALELVAGI